MNAAASTRSTSPRPDVPPSRSWPLEADPLALAIRYVRQRDRRREALGADMFREPAWDILLDLYCAGLAGRDVSIMDACAASRVPVTTGLRYVRRLLASKLVIRVDDASDRRRSLVRLSSEASERMEAWLRETWSFAPDPRG